VHSIARTSHHALSVVRRGFAKSSRHPICLFSLLFLFIPHAALAQSAAEWSQIKSNCNLPSSTVYNDWVAQGCPCNKTGGAAASGTTAAPAPPAGLTPEQQLGTQIGMMGANMIGQGLRQLLSGPPAARVDPAQQQRLLAAQQLNNSGVYLFKQKNYSGAINLFQQALANSPGDKVIAANLALAQQRLEQSRKNSAAATQTSNALAQFLNSPPAALPSSPVNAASPALNSVDLNSDTKVVDLRGTTRTSVDPAMLKGAADQPGQTQQQLQQDLDEQFDKAMNQSDVQTITEQKELDAEFDKLYNDAQLYPAGPVQQNPPSAATRNAAAMQERAALQAKLASVNARCAAAESGSVAEASCKKEQAELVAALAKFQ
jgi:tetratricopeptide (TPR) repeat protein